jgi:hypothetical protein
MAKVSRYSDDETWKNRFDYDLDMHYAGRLSFKDGETKHGFKYAGPFPFFKVSDKFFDMVMERGISRVFLHIGEISERSSMQLKDAGKVGDKIFHIEMHVPNPEPEIKSEPVSKCQCKCCCSNR